jgi:RNA polymerase-binding transcription factor DksA
MEYHAATSAGIEDRQARRLLRRAVAARQRLADTEDALSRVTAGAFGRCEQCGAGLPEALLSAMPESRYCVDCAGAATGPLPAGALPVGTEVTGAGLR